MLFQYVFHLKSISLDCLHIYIGIIFGIIQSTLPKSNLLGLKK